MVDEKRRKSYLNVLTAKAKKKVEHKGYFIRDNGYDMPDPDFTNDGPGQGGAQIGPIDPDDPDFVSADEACRSIFTEAGFDGLPRGGRGGGGN